MFAPWIRPGDEVPVPPYATGIIPPFQVPDVIVPTEVRLDPVTVLLSVVPVRVPAAAVTVPLPPRLIAVPLTVSELFASCAFVIVPLRAVVGIVVDAVIADVPFP